MFWHQVSKTSDLPGSCLGGRHHEEHNQLDVQTPQASQQTDYVAEVKKAKVDTARLMRTGAVEAMTHGQAVAGVANSTLLAQRRAVAAAVAPAGPRCGHKRAMPRHDAGDCRRQS